MLAALEARPAFAAWLAFTIAVTAFYGAIFLAFADRLAAATATNVLPLIALTPIVYRLVQRLAVGRALPRQAIVHAVLLPAFVAVWYFAIITLQGLSHGSLIAGFRVYPFVPLVIAWNAYQGLAFYVAAAAVAYAIDARVALARVPAPPPVKPPPLGRLLLRQGDEMLTVDVADVVRIQGSDDYSEVVLDRGRRLVRRTLAEFVDELDPRQFVRVHRSHVINLDALIRAEPAGNGRLTLNLRNGDVVIASRAGTRLLRGRAR